MNEATLSVELRIDGRVQGVGYRAWLAATAERHGLAGWVRNHRDGTVGALLSGPRAEVEAVIERCRSGPALARVHEVRVQPSSAPTDAGFRVRSTI